MARKPHPLIKSVSSSEHKTTEITQGSWHTTWIVDRSNCVADNEHDIYTTGDAQFIGRFTASVNAPDNGRAHAMLIAAAPDLRDALRDTLRMLEAAHRQLGMYSADNTRVQMAYAALRARPKASSPAASRMQTGEPTNA